MNAATLNAATQARRAKAADIRDILDVCLLAISDAERRVDGQWSDDLDEAARLLTHAAEHLTAAARP